MSRILTLALSLFFVATLSVDAQIKTPAPSPSASFSQDFGLVSVSAEYSRPAKNGRTIFAADGLVPFGKVWRTGANAVTKVTFSGDVMVEGKDLKGGSYAILTKPGASSWDIHFYDYESGNWGSYVEKDPSLVVTVSPKMVSTTTESFLIYVDDISSDAATLNLAWDKTVVPVSLKTEVDAQVMANIEKVLAGPTAGDYYAAGVYYYNADKDLNKALEYVQKATHSDSPRFWQVRMESQILAKLGKYKEAIKVAEKSKALAMEAGNDDYVKINSDNIAKWMKM